MNETIDDSPQPGLGLPQNPMMEFYRWAAENKPMVLQNNEVKGDVPEFIKIDYYSSNNKNVKLANMTEKEIKLSRLNLMRQIMFDRTFTPKNRMTSDYISSQNKLEHDFLHTSSQSRNNEFMKTLTTIRTENFNRIRDDRMPDSEPQPRWD